MSYRHFAEADSSAGFDCRDADMSSFLAKDAARFHTGGWSRIYIRDDAGGTLAFVGFYAIAMSSVQQSAVPADVALGERSSLPRHLPVALLGRVARDQRAPAGTGKELVLDALKRIDAIASQIGCVGVALHAKNDELVAYYQKFGFIRIGHTRADQPRLMIFLFASLDA